MARGPKRKRGHELQDSVLQEDQKRYVPAAEEEHEDEQFISRNGVGSESHLESEQDTGMNDDGDEMEASDEEMHPGEEEDQEEWGGIEVSEGRDEGETHYEKKPRKPPTGEELRNIKDASELYRSSSFKLQIDALLPNVRPKYQRSGPLDRFLLALHSFIKSLPPIDVQHPLVAAQSLLKKGIAVPFPIPSPTEDTNWKVMFEPPAELMLVGSWHTKHSVKAKDKRPYSVDLAVEMPSSLFQEKDYLNSRFFHKRAYYLGVIAAAITQKKSGLNVEALFDSISGDPRLTTLVLRPREDGSVNDYSKLRAQVRIIPTLPSESPISLQRLAPRRSNIRATLASFAADSMPDSGRSTPLYNTALLLSYTPRQHLLRLYHLKQEVPAFDDALTLLRVWANQRGYSEGSKLCIRGFEGKGMFWASILDLLITGEETSSASIGKSAVKRNPLGKSLSSYQLFRAALDLLARHDFERHPVFLRCGRGHRFSPEEYSVHEAVMVDSTSLVNLLAGVSLSSLDMLRHDAKMTLEALSTNSLSTDSSYDPFQEIFMKDLRDLQARFDVVLRVNLSSAKPPRLTAHSLLDHGSPYNALLFTLTTTLRKGLGSRAKAIAVLHPSSEPRPSSQAQAFNPPVVHVGLILDPEHAFRLVDHGPAAENPDPEAAKEFREFWGNKAELRRFKDGSIVESVVWDVKNADERAQVPFYIARYLLARHCGIQTASVQNWQSSYDAVLRLPESMTTHYQAANASTGFKAAVNAFDRLVKNIKTLDDEMPLAILNISPVAESLRYTSVFSPVALPSSLSSLLPSCARYLPLIDIIVEFERSGRWPDDLRAIQKIKLAFFEKLGNALMKSVDGLQASVVVSGGVSASEIQDIASLEIITPEGWAFSARIWHDREVILLDKMIDDNPHISKHVKKLQKMQSPGRANAEANNRQAALEAKEICTRRFIHGPRHHRVIAALSHRFTAYAGTVRLVKRWLASHWLLSGHVGEEAVELLCAHIFLAGSDPDSSNDAHREFTPSTRERGFALVVEFLKDWEWVDGLFVAVQGDQDLSEGATEDARILNHTGGRTGVWRISTKFDQEGYMWTNTGPDVVVARRVRAIAKATWTILEAMDTESFEVKTLFAHPTEDYDFLVELDTSQLPRYYQSVAVDQSVWKIGKYANTALLNGNVQEAFRPGLDPARLFFDDLQRVYKDTFKIFCDPLGGNRFGAVWDPTLRKPRTFRVLNAFSSIPLPREGGKDKNKDKVLVALNTAAILSEIERLGAGLISAITVQV